MKNLITSMACIAILLVFVLQFTQNQVLYNRMTAVDQDVNSFKEIIKQEGALTPACIKNLKEKISKDIFCNVDDVVVSGTKERVMRGKIIYYKVSVPVEGVVAASGFWSIRDEDNKMVYTIERQTTSEYIGR